MLALIWDIDELKRLNDEGRNLHTEVSAVLDIASMSDVACQEQNLPQKLTSIRTRLCGFVKGLYRFKRTPASHMFVMMISSELCDTKPYALPVQCLPYAGLKERDMRHMVTRIVKEMVTIGMAVAGTCKCTKAHLYSMKIMSSHYFFSLAGFVSDGEFRSKGYTRPLSILQIRTDVRNKFSKTKQDVLLCMLTPKGIVQLL